MSDDLDLIAEALDQQARGTDACLWCGFEGLGAHPSECPIAALARVREREAALALACSVLVRLVRSEYSRTKSLPEIAAIWGNATPEELDALRSLAAAPGDKETA